MRRERRSRAVSPVAHRALERFLIVVRFHVDFQVIAKTAGEIKTDRKSDISNSFRNGRAKDRSIRSLVRVRVAHAAAYFRRLPGPEREMNTENTYFHIHTRVRGGGNTSSGIIPGQDYPGGNTQANRSTFPGSLVGGGG